MYETLQSLDLARSWMGTVNWRGHKKRPPIPLPLSVEEIAKFKGLEEEQEVFEDMFGGDYTGRTDSGADLLAQYAGYDVGQMVKVLRGNFEGEDGTVRRLKDGQLMVRMLTYGQTYTWGIKKCSSWNGGEYEVYGQSTVEEEKECKRRLAVAHTDLGATSGRGPRAMRSSRRFRPGAAPALCSSPDRSDALLRTVLLGSFLPMLTSN